MVTFEFVVDQNVLLEDLAMNPSGESLAVVQETYFVFPIRLNINGNEMFSLSEKRLVLYSDQTERELNFTEQTIENAWIRLPLLHLIFVGFGQIRKACKGEVTSYSLPGTGAMLIMTPTQGKIEVRSTLNGKTETVECQELIDAFNSFKNQALDFIKSNVPAIEQHPEWEMNE